jgi:transposase-like protein
MSSMEDALAALESLEPGKSDSYSEIARKHGVDRSTLSRRHRSVTTSRAADASTRRKLNPRQELELVRYIEGLTKRRLPPTREMIRNFAMDIAKRPVSDS